MPTHSRNPRRSPISALHLALCAWSLLPACSPKTPARHAPPDTHDPTPLLLDFEQPNPPVTWTPAPAALSTTTQPATPPALSRSALRPNTGLWSMKISLPSQSAGTLSHAFATPVDLHAADTLQLAAMHLGPPARSATVAAAVTLTDGSGTSVTGDFYPLFSKWQTIPLDLATAATPTGTAPPLDLSHIASIGMVLKPLPASTRAGAATTEPADEPLDIQTDSWAALPDRHTYVGDHQPNTFYAERRGSRLLVGMADAYELAFTDQSTFDQPDPAPTAHAPFLTISQGPNHRIVVGQPHTGLELLGPQSLEGLAMESGPATLPTSPAPSL